MSIIERIFHAILFELLAILISIIAIKFTTTYPITEATVTIVLISLIAVIWNFLFNWLFDFVFTGAREKRKLNIRIFHAVSFEIGLLIFTLPLISHILKISYTEAFIMDIGLTVLILIYTVIFNWLYDHLRLKIIFYKSHSSKYSS